MTKTITILAISTIILSITFIPLAEGTAGWNGFLREIGFGGTQVYEVSGVSLIPAGTTVGSIAQLRCLDGDWFQFPWYLSIDDPSIDRTNLNIVGTPGGDVVREDEPAISFQFQKQIGVDISASQNGALQLFDIPVTVTGLCVSPSPLSSIVGGEWQGTDTVALFIGYSVLNAYWLAPTMAGLAAGIYLTKNKWKR